MEKFLACKFSKKVAKLASQNIPYTYFMFTSRSRICRGSTGLCPIRELES